jgi:hypothetical protein
MISKVAVDAAPVTVSVSKDVSAVSGTSSTWDYRLLILILAFLVYLAPLAVV